MPKKQKEPFYLGDREFTAKMVKIYSWIMPFIFAAMAILMLISKAPVSALIFLFGAIVMIPKFRDRLQQYHFNSIARFIFCAVIILLGIYSTTLYA